MKLASKTYPAQSLATRYEPTFYIPSIPGHTQLNGCSTDANRFCSHKVQREFILQSPYLALQVGSPLCYLTTDNSIGHLVSNNRSY
jgi:hypothetical protein